MDNVTGERMPFTELPGKLYIAPLGTLMPQNFASSEDGEHEQRFVDSWSAGWILVGETDPELCRARGESSAEPAQVATHFDPVRFAVTERSMKWTFGLGAIEMKRLTKVHAARPESPLTPARMMLGWQSLDRTCRTFAPQMFVCEGFDSDSTFTVALERPYVPPAPKPPAPTRWQRILRQLRLWSPPHAPLPPVPPLFEVYYTGQLHHV